MRARKARTHTHSEAEETSRKAGDSSDLFLGSVLSQSPSSAVSGTFAFRVSGQLLVSFALPLTSRKCGFSSQTWLGSRGEMMLTGFKESA